MRPIVTLFFLIICQGVGFCQIAPETIHEYWISTNVTGSMLNRISSSKSVGKTLQSVAEAPGTFANPLDGSTFSNFDDNMNLIPSHSVVHIMAGTYQTRGSFGWGPKTGQQIVGSGMGLTILQLPAGLVASGKLNHDLVISPQSPYFQTNILVSDLTLDCNYQPGTISTIDGIMLIGSGNTIRRVKLINAFSFTASKTNYVESWGIYIASYPYPAGAGNLIEDCIVAGYKCNYGNDQSSLGLLENESGIIAHNTIIQDSTNYMYGIGFGSHNVIADGNIMVNVTLGSHYDSRGGITNCTIVNNKFINCNAAIDWANVDCRNVTVAFNDIVLTNEASRRYSCEAVHLFGSGTAENFSLFGNNVIVASHNQVHRPNIFVSANNATGLIIKDNRVDASLTNRFVNCHNVVIAENYDLLGNDSPLNENFESLDSRSSAPTFAQIGSKTGKVFLWVSNSTPPTIYYSYYGPNTNLLTKWSQ